MQRNNLAYFVIIGLLLGSCATSKVVTGGNSSGTNRTNGNTSTTTTQSPSKKNDKTVNEDLSVYRPKYKSSDDTEVIANDKPSTSAASTINDSPMHINKRLDAILDTIAMHNKSIKFTNGFRIQIYVGNDRKAADDAKIYTYQKYPEIFPYLSYQLPIYKVKIGDFLNRMDAERYFSDIKELFPAAMILPDRVEIKKGMMVSK
jgi:hypothetical protein